MWRLATRWRCSSTVSRAGRTYRGRGGRREQGQDPTAGNDDVVDHLRDEVDGVVYKYDVLIAVDKVHDGLGGVAAREEGERHIQKTFKNISGIKYPLEYPQL